MVTLVYRPMSFSVNLVRFHARYICNERRDFRNALSHHLRVAISTSFGVGQNGLFWLGCDMVCDMELLSDGVLRFSTS